MWSRRAPVLPLAVALAAALGGCGDDPKQGSRGSPAAAPGGASPATDAAPGAPRPSPAPATTPTPAPPPPAPAPAGAVRVGDWATWEVRVDGSESVTRITWRALRVDGGRVRFSVEARTTDAAGREIASARSEEERGADAPRVTAGAAETVHVAGRDLTASTAREGEAEVTRSPEVPLGGLVRLRGPGGTTQALVDFGRGP